MLVGLAALSPPVAGKTARLNVITTLSQIAEPMRVIAGDDVMVESLMGEGVDPHLYRPVRSDILRLARADVIVWNGLGLEIQLADALERLGETRPVLAIGETLPEDQLIRRSGAVDPHIWMDPQLWKQAIEQAINLLGQHDPAIAPALRQRAQAYFVRLDALDRDAQAMMATIPPNARLLVTAHDAFGYLGRRYGIEVLGVQGISTDSEAGLLEIEQLVGTLVRRSVPAIFHETSVSDRNIRALIDGAAARGHTVVAGGMLYSDAMGSRDSPTGTYIGMLRHNVTTIVAALGGDAS